LVAPRRVLLALPLLGGCRGTDIATALTPLGGSLERRAIAYGALPRQRLDLTLPAGAARALVVFFYGGGFDSGDRGDYRFVARVLAARGLAVVVPDYRVWPEGRWPDFLDDAAAAIAWARGAEGAAAGLPPALPTFLIGHSAGGFIALALALDPRWLGADRQSLAGVVGLAGVYDWSPREEPLRTVFAAAPNGRIDAAPDAAALGNGPPLLLAHGTADLTVRPEQSQRLAARVTAAGGNARLLLYPEVGHIGIVAAVAAPLRALGWAAAPVLDDLLDFLTERITASEPAAGRLVSHP